MPTTAQPTPRLLRESYSAYRELCRSYFTGSDLWEFRQCPKRYKQRQSGMIAEVIQDDEYRTNAAAHVLLLEGQAAFEAERNKAA